jgi:histone acetyltransferase (RNA polymerase elongator complex component)
MNVGMCTMAPELILTAYFVHPSHQPVCLYVHPAVVVRQRLGRKLYHGNEYTHNNRRIVVSVVLCAVRVVSKESKRLVLRTTSCYIF